MRANYALQTVPAKRFCGGGIAKRVEEDGHALLVIDRVLNHHLLPPPHLLSVPVIITSY